MTYEATTEQITVVEGVEVDITVRGDEDRAEKVLMDLKERLGRLSAAYESETPPDQLPEDLQKDYPNKVPPATVAWDRVFSEEDE